MPFAGLSTAKPLEASVGSAYVLSPSFSGRSARSHQAPSTPYLLISLILKLSSQGQSLQLVPCDEARSPYQPLGG